MQLPVRSIPRPSFAAVFSEYAEPEVLFWISEQRDSLDKAAYQAFINTLPQAGASPSFRDLLLSLAAGAKREDAFAYCEELKSVLDWPVDAELVAIFTRIIKDTRARHLRTKTIEWVMATGTRFNAKPGTEVTFFDDSRRSNRRGTVVSVDRPIATATVKLATDEQREIVAELLVA